MRGRRSAGRTLALAAAVLAALGAAGEAGAAVTRFETKADSYVSAANPRGSFGSARVLQVRGRPLARSYVRFDVAGLSGSVTNVTLELVPRTSSPTGLIVQAAARGLTERGTRLRNAPRPQGRAVTSKALKAGVVLRIDVTKLVSGQGSVTFMLTSRGRRLIKLASREGVATARPRLLVTTNAAPACSSITLSAVEDTAASRAPECADTDGDALSVSVLSQPSKGSASVVGGNLQYVPSANANGSDSFVIRAADGRAASPPSTVTVSIRAVNDAPTCVARALTITEDGSGAVAPSCSDVDGDALTYSILSQAVKGAASVVAGELRYAPDADAFGADSFTYRARDGSLPSEATSVSVTVQAVNDVPVCAAVSITTDEDTAGETEPSCTDADRDVLTYAVMSQPAKGAASVAGGKLTLVPNADANGVDGFTYRASDASSASTAAAVSVTIGGINDAPTCASRTLSTSEDTAATVTPSCTDLDGDGLTYEIVAQGAKGTASVTPQGLRYAPTADLNGADSFTYRARDASAASPPATVSVAITGTDDPPVCAPVTITLPEDSDGSVAGACSDPEGQPVTYSVASDPLVGLAREEDGVLHYVPFANQTGGDSFTYRASDGIAAGTPAAVTVTITPVNDAPEALPQLVRTGVNTSRTVTLEGYDEEGDPLDYQIESLPAHGLLYKGSSATGTPIAALALPVRLTGDAGDKVTYRPNTGYTGADMFEFATFDGTEASIPADIEIDVRGVNHAPVCTNQSVTLDEDGDFWLAVCSDQDGDEMTFTRTGPTHGTLEIFEDGQANYVPHANYNGPDSFSVSAKDTSNASSIVATVTITVVPVNDAPVCRVVLLTTPEDTASTLLPDCEDPDGQPMAYSIAGAAAKGAASVTATGGLHYVPDANENGTDSFTYAASDGTLTSEAARVDVQVSPVNDRPVCRQVAITTPVGVQGTANPDCEDADGDALSYSIVAQPAAGVASFSTGLLRYVPSAAGSYSFTYQAKDALVFSTAATVNVTVSAS